MTFDGASPNRRLLAIHDTSRKDLYKVDNIHAEDERHIYFFSDPPHLIKTTRNCWLSKSRNLWVCIYHYNYVARINVFHLTVGKWQKHFMATFEGLI